MTIDEAIKHCEEVAEGNDLAAGMYEILAENNHNAYEKLTAETNSSRCAECSADHIQLAEWLRGLKNAKALLGDIKSYYKSGSECKEYKCEDCVHFDECGWGKQHPDGYKWRFEDAVNALIGGNDEITN